MSKEIKLSFSDSEKHQELMMDVGAVEHVFNQAHFLYTNAMAKMERSKGLMWEHFREAYNLDDEKQYSAKYSFLERRVVVTEIDDEDNA